VGALIEQDRVVLDVAVVADPEVAEPAAIPAAQIAAHPVVVELVVVGAGADADAARSRRRGGEQLVAGGRVQRDIVVLDVHVHVMAVRQHDTRYRALLARAGSRVGGAPLDVRGRIFALTYVDTAGERAGVVGDPVVRDLQVMPPAVHPDAAATLRAVLDGEAVDARRVAGVVARERIGGAGRVQTLGAGRIRQGVLQQRSPGREGPGFRGGGTRSKRIRSGREQHALAQHGDAGPF